jgi:DNA (cytosine-5)-methyltransferase 1
MEAIATEIDVVQEKNPDTTLNSIKTNKIIKEDNTLNILSLFSGCGGMDLGFEGGFSVLKQSINENLTPHFIDKN